VSESCRPTAKRLESGLRGQRTLRLPSRFCASCVYPRRTSPRIRNEATADSAEKTACVETLSGPDPRSRCAVARYRDQGQGVPLELGLRSGYDALG
jgi:hypothetical protein